MPFADEISAHGVVVLPYNPAWPIEYRQIETRLTRILGELAIGIDHIGSTSIPGMAAKDCIDIQLRVHDVHDARIEHRLTAAGFRRRPEPWNNEEISLGTTCPKQVYAPPAGERGINIHVRPDGAANSRFNLLFRDFLRANPEMRDTWAAFKHRLAQSAPNLSDYGQIKQLATHILLEAAEAWQRDRSFTDPVDAVG
jgi:GrpB-like predicted nucleotidyltransferase (UPF0157 family)